MNEADASIHQYGPEAGPFPTAPVVPQPVPAAAPPRRIGVSFRASYARRVQDGFMSRYLSGNAILDIGFRGGDPDAVPITETAIGIELDYPGYDGTHLPFPDESQDAVLAAHVIEHIYNHQEVLREWYRVLRIGGYLVIIVPHRHLYERRCDLPSRWNGDHKRFYSPASLLAEIEQALPVNGYRVRHLMDNDHGFDYRIPPEEPAGGGYEIEFVLERIARPSWADKLTYPPAVAETVRRLDSIIFLAIAETLKDGTTGLSQILPILGTLRYFTPWGRVYQRFVFEGAPELGGVRVDEKDLRAVVSRFLAHVTVDDAVYLKHADLRAAYAAGKFKDPTSHWRADGYFEGRVGHGYEGY